jgi:hypothetical protein
MTSPSCPHRLRIRCGRHHTARFASRRTARQGACSNGMPARPATARCSRRWRRTVPPRPPGPQVQKQALTSIPGAVIELRCRSGRESRMKPPPDCSAVPSADLREVFRQRLRLHAIACSASQRRSNRIRCSRRAELRGPLAVQRGGTGPADHGIRNRLSDWPGLVHVDQLRRQTLRTTTSLVTSRINAFAARTIPPVRAPGNRG